MAVSLVGVVTILLQALLPPELRVFREAFLFLAVTSCCSSGRRA
ncbi:MAG: hypothetical protein QM805_11775 [Pseudomonas sp.]